MDFNGSTSKIDCGSYDTLVGNITIYALIKPRSFGESGYGRFIDNGKVVGSVYATGSRLGFSSDGYTTTALSAASSIVLGNTYFVVVTRTSTGITNIFINGVLSGTANQASGTPAAGTANITLGNNSAASYTQDGTIPLVGVYSGILSSQEISQMWTNIKGQVNQ